jgi:hypothetical protein
LFPIVHKEFPVRQMISAARGRTIRSVFTGNGGRQMATMRLALGLLCVIHPLIPGVGVSLTACVLGLGLIVSALLPRIDNEDAHDFDFSR